MEVSEIGERIKVRADFYPNGKVMPLLFKRNGYETFRVSQVNSTWEDREQEHRLLYFSVSVEGSDDVFQLCFREDDRTWWLQYVMLNG